MRTSRYVDAIGMPFWRIGADARRRSWLLMAYENIGMVIGDAVLHTGVHLPAFATLLLLTFGPPHHVKRPAASIDAAILRAVDARIDAARLATADDVLHFALDATAERLHFGLAHRTSLVFAEEREGNCIEYAHLFAALFERARTRAHVDARAFVVHSDDARVLGTRFAPPGLNDHDWSLVVAHTPAGERRLFVDPTLYDAGMGWDIASSVSGAVRVP
jgi:hypothetical protein